VGPAAGLTRDELRRCDRVVEAVEAARSLPEFLAAALAALHEHFGLRGEFMLALSEGPLPGHRAYAGASEGYPEHMMEEYFERWADRDALTSEPARFAYYRTGRAAPADVYPELDVARRRYVDDFLRRVSQTGQVSFRLAAGHSDGYLTLGELEDERVVRHLVPTLTELLQRRLPHGLEADLSLRERQVSELVSLGFSNREIAGVLHVEEDTIKKHVSRAMSRLGLSRRTQLAVAWATGTLMVVTSSGL
jgi:DNA-binding CsgD family transcriptional regulator